MEDIRVFVEELIQLTGVTGDIVPVLRHALLTITAILLAVLSDVLCRKLIVPLVLKVTAKTDVTWDDILFNRDVLVSACHIVPAVVIWSLIPMIYFQFPLVQEVLARGTAIYITVMSVKTALIFISSFKEIDSDRRSSAQQYFHTFVGVLRILILFVAAVVVVAIVLGKNPLTLFAGLGATSAVLMLIFKDTIVGMVAGVRLTSNDMLHKGDWITVKSVDANGIVEEMTLTTVKVRNFDNTIVTISPSTLVSGSFQNWIGMQKSAGRRVNRKVYFDFRSVRLMDDGLIGNLRARHLFSEKEMAKLSAGTGTVNMQLYREYMERYLRSREEVNGSMTLMVRQLEATQCGLPLEFYFFIKDKTWVNYEHILADIMEHAYAAAPEFGLTIYQQYPDQ